MVKKSQQSGQSLKFGLLVDLKKLIRGLNKAGKAKYQLIKQNAQCYLLEQDLGGDFLDYFILQVQKGEVWAVSDDVMTFLRDLQKKGGGEE